MDRGVSTPQLFSDVSDQFNVLTLFSVLNFFPITKTHWWRGFYGSFNLWEESTEINHDFMCVSHLYVSDCVLQCCWLIHKVRTQGECWNLQRGKTLSYRARHFSPLGLSYIQRTCRVLCHFFCKWCARQEWLKNQRPLYEITDPKGLCVKVQQLP